MPVILTFVNQLLTYQLSDSYGLFCQNVAWANGTIQGSDQLMNLKQRPPVSGAVSSGPAVKLHIRFDDAQVQPETLGAKGEAHIS